jgi:hypothetical protein
MKKIIYGFLALFTMASVVPAVSMAGNNQGGATAGSSNGVVTDLTRNDGW